MTTATAPAETRSATGLAIHLRFVTNRCVATQVSNREQPEWPPHPGRVFMALAAAYYETDGTEDDKQAERAALEWLETLPAPHIEYVDADARSPVTCYVPVNDRLSPNKAMLQSAPGMPRSRQSRSFPTVIPLRDAAGNEFDPDTSLIWSDLPDAEAHLPALDRLCGHVIRVGHSSSLVMVWTSVPDNEPVNDSDRLLLEPTDRIGTTSCRIATAGELERLQAACRADEIELFARLKIEIDSTKGKPRKEAKAKFKQHFGQPYKAALRAPEPSPATLGIWQSYRRVHPGGTRPIHINSYFERALIVLAKHDGPMLSVERTLGLTRALKQAAIACTGSAPVPAWLSGHDADESPTSEPHAAFLTLPFAGYPHADGHIMGLAIALPRGIAPEERGRWLGPLLVDQQTGDAASRTIKLWGRDLPDWTVQLEDRLSPPRMLQNETWTGPATTWASVTPVVLDRFPKSSRTEDRTGWQREAQEIIATACKRSGLPEPMKIDVDTTAWHAGIPRAWTKTRRLRPPLGEKNETELGDGFPSLPTKPTRPAKPQVHIWLRFDRRVTGPVLLGAGRFQGYGLCMPTTNQPELKS